jgi:transposase
VSKMTRRYSESFKSEAVKLALAGRVSKARIARELGININSLDGWIRKYKESLGELDPRKVESLEDVVKRLRKENDVLRQERDILKKAAAYFAREQQ